MFFYQLKVFFKYSNDKTPLDIAKESKNEEIEKLLS